MWFAQQLDHLYRTSFRDSQDFTNGSNSVIFTLSLSHISYPPCTHMLTLCATLQPPPSNDITAMLCWQTLANSLPTCNSESFSVAYRTLSLPFVSNVRAYNNCSPYDTLSFAHFRLNITFSQNPSLINKHISTLLVTSSSFSVVPVHCSLSPTSRFEYNLHPLSLSLC